MSIINLSHKFIFVHVPKSAGTSVTAALSWYTTFCDLEIGGTALGEELQPYYLKRFGVRKHSTAREIRQLVGDAVWSHAFKFAFVRHPFARSYSIYHFLKHRFRTWKGSEIMDSFHDFSGFVRSDFFLTNDGPDQQFRPQWFWIRDEASDRAVVDFIGRVENLEKDLAHVIDRIAIPCLDAPMSFDPATRANSSTEPDEWRRHVDSEAQELIIKRHQPDFDRLGYSRTVQA
jgi:hypothetical protein